MEVVEFEIDRTPTLISPSMLDLFMRHETSHMNITQRTCGFCGEFGHITINCQHCHIDLLERSAKFIYLMNIRYLKSMNYNMSYHREIVVDRENHDEMIHTRWLDNLTIPEKKILCRINQIDFDLHPDETDYTIYPGDRLFKLLHEYYFDYTMSELENNEPSISIPRLIQNIYYVLFENVTTLDFRQHCVEPLLNNVIENSGRHLLNFDRIRTMMRIEIEDYMEDHSENVDRYFENTAFNSWSYPSYSLMNEFNNEVTYEYSSYIPPKIIIGSTHENETTTPDCPICFGELNQTTNRVVTNCKHTCCNDCISQIVNNTKENKEIICFMCRATINELTVSNKQIKDSINNNTNNAFE